MESHKASRAVATCIAAEGVHLAHGSALSEGRDGAVRSHSGRAKMLVVVVVVSLLAVRCRGAPPSPQQVSKSCPEGYELKVDEASGKYDCSCLPYHLYWSGDGLCYREFTRGPCPPGHRLVYNDDSEKAECQCPAYWARGQDGACYQEYSRGPCPEGELLVADLSGGGEAQCVCNRSMLMHYHVPSGKCYELYSQGPCPAGHMVRFDYRALAPECTCRDGHVKWSDGKCHELNTPGPCPQCPEGTPCFVRSLETLRIGCRCLIGATSPSGQCHQLYSRGGCPYGEWLAPKNDSSPSCQPKPQCQRFDNWFYWPAHERCYRQFSRGPCQKGLLFHLDPATGEAGCGCSPHWKAYFWEATGQCFEQDSRGPCPAGHYFALNHTSGRTECNCFRSYVLNPGDGTCVEKYTQGPCQEGELVLVEEATGAFRCDCGKHLSAHFWEQDGRCYEHHRQGPCQSGQLFKVDEATGRPACLSWPGRK